MASHVDLLTELQLLEKVPTLERLRAAQKRRAQQLKKWAQYEQDLQHRKRKHERKRSTGGRRKKVSFEASVALLEASLRNDAEEGRPLWPRSAGQLGAGASCPGGGWGWVGGGAGRVGSATGAPRAAGLSRASAAALDGVGPWLMARARAQTALALSVLPGVTLARRQVTSVPCT